MSLNLTKEEWIQEIDQLIFVMDQDGVDEIVFFDARETLCTLALCLGQLWLVDRVVARNALHVSRYLQTTKRPKTAYVKRVLTRCLNKTTLRVESRE